MLRRVGAWMKEAWVAMRGSGNGGQELTSQEHYGPTKVNLLLYLCIRGTSRNSCPGTYIGLHLGRLRLEKITGTVAVGIPTGNTNTNRSCGTRGTRSLGL
eukprot:1653084-Rhodomonas_salina.1